MRTALYRHFDSAGQLLYVGISNDVLRRLCQHKDRADWFEQIARIDVEWLADRDQALEAETAAINAERPLWNIRKVVACAAPQAPVTSTERPGAHPLVGKFLHTFDEAGELRHQAVVTAVDGDAVLAQMFSWFTGAPTTIQAFERSFIYSDRVRLYASQEAWISAAERLQQAEWRDA